MPKKSANPRGNILHVRFSPEERGRIDARADREYIRPSTWVRQVILRALEEDAGRGESPLPTPRDGTPERTSVRTSERAPGRGRR